MNSTNGDAARYEEQGFLTRLPGLRADEAKGFLDQLLAIEAEQERLHRRPVAIGRQWRDRSFRPHVQADHPLRDWLGAVARHPAIGDAVARVLGDHLLVRNADIVIRPARSLFGSAWHRDTAHTGPAVDRMVTAWVALTPATRMNGCMRFIAGSHRRPPARRTGFSLDPRPRLRQLIDPELREDAWIDLEHEAWNELDAGQISLHHMRTLHGSGTNWTGSPRVALVLRFLADDVDPSVAGCGEAMLVRGRHRNRGITLRDAVTMQWSP
ncbi:MAG: phytanoyl-CoA dioxygenase family protein [Myxococcales bacterium]|nr:phytanoyl-CoA dioxygenase family protein [Myxococcales bacterium]